MQSKVTVMVETNTGIREQIVESFEVACKTARAYKIFGVDPNGIYIIDENNYVYKFDGKDWGNQIATTAGIVNKVLAY